MAKADIVDGSFGTKVIANTNVHSGTGRTTVVVVVGVSRDRPVVTVTSQLVW